MIGPHTLPHAHLLYPASERHALPRHGRTLQVCNELLPVLVGRAAVCSRLLQLEPWQALVHAFASRDERLSRQLALKLHRSLARSLCAAAAGYGEDAASAGLYVEHVLGALAGAVEGLAAQPAAQLAATMQRADAQLEVRMYAGAEMVSMCRCFCCPDRSVSYCHKCLHAIAVKPCCPTDNQLIERCASFCVFPMPAGVLPAGEPERGSSGHPAHHTACIVCNLLPPAAAPAAPA